MPRLTPYTSSVSLNAQQGVTAGADSFGGASARATSGMGDELGRTGDAENRVEDAKSRMRTANFLSGADLDWRQQMIARQSDPEFAAKYGEDGSNFAEAFKNDFEEYAQKTIGDADPRDRKYVEQGMYNLGESLMASSMDFQAQFSAQFAVDTLSKTVDNARQSANMSPEQYASIMANAQMTISQAPHIDATARRRLAEAATQDITTSAALGLLEKQGAGAAQRLLDNKMSFSVIGEDGSVQTKSIRDILDEKTYATLSTQADAVISKAKTDALQVVTDLKDDLDTQIALAETPEQFTNAALAMEKNAGILGQKNMNDLRVKYHNKTKKQREEDETIAKGNMFATGQAYLNPRDTKAVEAFDNYYARQVEPTLAELDPNVRNARLTQLVDTTKVLPTRLKGDIAVAARSRDQATVVQAADFVDRLRNTNPHLIQDFDQGDLARLDMLNSMFASGYNATEAYSRVDAMLDSNNKATFDARTAELKEFKIDYQGKALSNFKANFFVKALPGESGSVADFKSNFAGQQANQITSEYRNAYETHYRMTGDKRAAEKHANTAVAGMYGVTKVNGKNQLMRFAPEKAYSIENVPNDWIRDQMLETAKEIMGATLTDNTTSADDYILVPDPFHTPRTMREGAPVYKIMKTGKDGTLVDVLGNGNFWYPDKDRKVRELLGEAAADRDRKATLLDQVPTGAGIR